MGRRQVPAKRRGTPTAALAAAAVLLLLGGLAALMSSGPNMFGMHLDWTASRAAVRNASAVTASGLLDGSSLLRSTGADPVADVAVQPFSDADLVDTQQQGAGGAAMSSFAAEAPDTQQGGSSSDSDSGGRGSIEQGPDRMIIVAHLAEDLSWLPMHLGDVPTAVYQFVPNLEQHQQQCPPGAEVDRPQGCPRYAAGHTGREASAYLQFIHDHYDSLPATMLFLHGHEKGWHRNSAVGLVRKLKAWGALPFANIRHWGFTDWECRHEAQQRGERPCSALGYCLTPGDPKAANDPQLNEPDAVRFYAVGASQMLAEHWDSLFKEELGDLPAMVVEPACCAEFMVTRERVRRRPPSFYRHALDVLQAAKDTDSFPLAVSFEAVWHMVFDEPPIVHAVSKCDLFECSEDERSDTRLQAPPVPEPYMLHHHWAAQQQQGAAAAAAAAAAADAAALPADQGSAAAPASSAATDTDLAADLAAAASGPIGADQLEAAARQAMMDAVEDSVGVAAPEHAAESQPAATGTDDVQQMAAAGPAEAEQAAADAAIEVLQIDADAIETQDAAAAETTGAQQGAAAGVALLQATAAGVPEVQPPDQLAPAVGSHEHLPAEQQVGDTEGQAAAADRQSAEGADLLVEHSGSGPEADVEAGAEASPAEAEGHLAAGSGPSSERQGPQHIPDADGEEDNEESDSSSDEARLAAALEQALASTPSTGQAADIATDGNAHAGGAATTAIAD